MATMARLETMGGERLSDGFVDILRGRRGRRRSIARGRAHVGAGPGARTQARVRAYVYARACSLSILSILAKEKGITGFGPGDDGDDGEATRGGVMGMFVDEKEKLAVGTEGLRRHAWPEGRVLRRVQHGEGYGFVVLDYSGLYASAAWWEPTPEDLAASDWHMAPSVGGG